jgi:hypothetical protein
LKEKKKRANGKQVAKWDTVIAGSSAVQAISHGMSFWILLLAGGLAVLCSLSLYFGLFVVGSTFGSILLVSITLYAFFKYWPEDEPLKPITPATAVEVEQPRQENVMIQVVQVDGPPKARLMMALRDASRKQDSFKINAQGAERFAKTIRYILQNS